MNGKRLILVMVILTFLLASISVYAADTTIELGGPTGAGDPQDVKTVGDIGIRFDVPAGKVLKQFVIKGSPTWENDDTEAELVLYRWDTDYDTTLDGSSLETYREHHPDNTDFVFNFTGNYGEGTYLVLLAADTATNSVGTWTTVYNDDLDAVTYVAGAKHEYMANTYIVVSDAPSTATMDASSILALTFVALTLGLVILKKSREIYI